MEVDNALAGTLNVASGGSLQGAGIIGTTSIASGATIAPGSSQSGSTGTLSVAGNYTQSSGATMAIALSPSAGGKLAVSGTATLDGALSLSPAAGTYVRGTTYDIVTASGVTGSFATVTNTAPSTVLLGITYGSCDVVATTESGTSNFSSVASTTDQKNLAAVLDRLSPTITGGSFNTTLNALSALGGSGQQQGLDQLDGHIATALVGGESGNLQAVLGSIASHLGSGLSGESFTLASDYGPSGEVQVADATDLYWGPDRSEMGNFSAWVQGFGEFQNQRSNGTGPGLSSALGGGSFGLEWRPDHQDRIGFVSAAAKGWMSVNDVAQTGTQNTYAAGMYGSHDRNQWTAAVAVLLGYNEAASQRQIALLNETANGWTDGQGAAIDGGLSYRADLGNDTTFTPRAGLSYSYSHENGYTETGAPGANLIIGDSGQNLVQSTLGATLASKFYISHDDGSLDILRPEARIGWRHDWINPQASVSESFAGVSSSSFTATGTNPGRNAAVGGIGLSFSPADMKTLALYAHYDGVFATNETDSTVTGGVRYSW